MVEFFWVARDKSVLQVADDSQPYEIVVPYHIVRYHEESQELFRKKKLSFLIVGVGKGSWVGIGVCFKELISIEVEFICC